MSFLAFVAAAAVLAIVAGLVVLARQRSHGTSSPTVDVRELRVASPADLREILQDPTVPPVVKGIVAQAAHAAGICACDVFDQSGQLTETDVDWLHSQRGEGR